MGVPRLYSLIGITLISVGYFTTGVFSDIIPWDKDFEGCIPKGGSLTFAPKCHDERIDIRTVDLRRVTHARQTTGSDGQCVWVAPAVGDCVDESTRPQLTVDSIRKTCGGQETCSHELEYEAIGACNNTYADAVHIRIVYKCWSSTDEDGNVVLPKDPTQEDIRASQPVSLIVLQSNNYPFHWSTMINITCQVIIEPAFQLYVLIHDLSSETIFQAAFDCPYTFEVKQDKFCAKRGAVYEPRVIYDPNKRTATLQFLKRNFDNYPQEAFQARFWVELRASMLYTGAGNGVSLSCVGAREQQPNAPTTPAGDSATVAIGINIIGLMMCVMMAHASASE